MLFAHALDQLGRALPIERENKVWYRRLSDAPELALFAVTADCWRLSTNYDTELKLL